MAITQVGSEWGVQTTATQTTLNLPSHSVTSGNAIVIATLGRSGTAPANVTPTDSRGNTYNKVGDIGNGVLRLQVYRATVGTGGATVITLTSSTTSGMAASAWEFNGLGATLNDISITGFSASSNNNPTIGPSGNTAAANELVFAVAANSSGTTAFSAQAFSPSTSPTIGSTWNTTGATCSLQAAWELSGAIGTQSYQATTSTTVVWNAILVTFAPVSVAGFGSSLQAGVIVPGTTAVQTYSGTLSSVQFWAAQEIVYTNVTAAAAPAQVIGVSANPGNNQGTVFWGTTVANGSPLTSYSLQIYIGGVLQSTVTGISAVPNYAVNPYTLTPLVAGTTYQVKVAGVNAIGTGTYSALSNFFTPASPTVAPSQPIAPTVVPGFGNAVVTATPPFNGGVPIFQYTFNCYLGAALFKSQTQAGTVYTFTGLADTTSYGFSVVATNSNGNSPESPQAFATTLTPTTVPDTPNAPGTTASDGSVTVTITPLGTGGVPITFFTFNCYNPDGSLFAAQQQVSPVYTFVGLTDGITYSFTGIASNSNGDSGESAPTFATPMAGVVPPPPPGPVASVGGRVGTTYQYVFRGKTTLMLYKFANIAIPATLLDQYGNILEYGPFNGETIVLCAQDGEVRRSVKGNPSPSDPYGFGIAVSPWESNV